MGHGSHDYGLAQTVHFWSNEIVRGLDIQCQDWHLHLHCESALTLVGSASGTWAEQHATIFPSFIAVHHTLFLPQSTRSPHHPAMTGALHSELCRYVRVAVVNPFLLAMCS